MVEEKTTPATLPAKVPVITVTKMQMNPTAVAVNAFATSLYAQLKSQPGNLFFSPYSLSSALTMTYAGAKGKTKEEMAKVLHLGANESVIHNGFGELERSLVSKTTYQLDLANAIWVQQRKVFLAAEFVELLQEAYHLGLKTADFETAAAQEILRINAWVAGKTANKIPKLLNSGMLTSQTQLVLTNAIYFKGKWQLPFNPEETKPLSFLKLDGVEVKVPTMYQKETFGYLEREEVQMIELPYKTSESSPGLSMVILLPTKTDGVGLSKVEEKLEDYLRLQSDLKPLKVSVYLPKFKVEAAFQLQEALQQMGMKVAFEPHQADFSGMTGKPELAISAVVHQAFAEVNEEGTEAAAATAVVGSRGRSLVFRADHPFVFWIRENRAGTVLFLGKVVNPQ
jgi:serpin B